MHRVSGTLAAFTLCAAIWHAGAPHASAVELVLKDGRVLSGKLGMVSSLANMPQGAPADSDALQLIAFLDNDLSRTFFSKRLIQEVRQQESRQLEEKFKVWQRTRTQGATVKSVGPIIEIKPFDEFGRRIFTFNTTNGPVAVRQGITEITPQWTKVEGESHVWDMRIATSSIPPDVLRRILTKQIDPKNIDHQKKIARFYIQSERYEEAQAQLAYILQAFPDQPDLKAQLQPSMQSLRQLAAQRVLAELKLRRNAGQHRMVLQMLKKFPTEDVAGEILQEVRESIRQYETLDARRKEVIDRFDALMKQISETALRSRIEPIRNEIAAELDIDTLGRMAAFRQSWDDADQPPSDKLALGISGWLLGADAAESKLSTALSLYKIRELVRKYLNEPTKLERETQINYITSEEASSPANVAGLLAHMKPPLPSPKPLDDRKPGYFKLSVAGLPKEPEAPYLVQLPPEYNPYRRYPTIVTLHGAGTTPEQQVDWWAGGWAEGGWRAGQATRQGYIVIAPYWAADHQTQYHYSAREHAAVLNSLRDACRRFAIDTDRVFLSGHSMGGDAAWDLALAHPDLWAGAIPIVAQADKYCALYWKNAKYVPMYIVGGELDGSKLTHNARDLDRYLNDGFNATVVEYLGRGHEHFYDEILRLFDWMGRLRRDFFPRDFACYTMRPWDNFFWYIEVGSLPPKTQVDPEDWPPPRGTQALQVAGKIVDNNGLIVRTGNSPVTVWLSPKMLDMSQRANILINGRRVSNGSRFVEPDLRTLLEDVRTRGDRQNPFWAKL